LSELISQLTIVAFSASMRNFRPRIVCSSINCNPLTTIDQQSRGKPRSSSHNCRGGAGSSGREFHNSPKRGPALKLLTSTITRIRIQQLFLLQKAVTLSAVSRHYDNQLS